MPTLSPPGPVCAVPPLTRPVESRASAVVRSGDASVAQAPSEAYVEEASRYWDVASPPALASCVANVDPLAGLPVGGAAARLAMLLRISSIRDITVTAV